MGGMGKFAAGARVGRSVLTDSENPPIRLARSQASCSGTIPPIALTMSYPPAIKRESLIFQ